MKSHPISMTSSPTKKTLDQATLEYLNDDGLVYNPSFYDSLSHKSTQKKKRRPVSSQNNSLLVNNLRNQSRVSRIQIRPKTAKLSMQITSTTQLSPKIAVNDG